MQRWMFLSWFLWDYLASQKKIFNLANLNENKKILTFAQLVVFGIALPVEHRKNYNFLLKTNKKIWDHQAKGAWPLIPSKLNGWFENSRNNNISNKLIKLLTLTY